jgi:5,10-methylenetetrahydromethanopterin reductase
MVRVKVGLFVVPPQPIDELLRYASLADELCLDAYHVTDDVYEWDAWQVAALVAAQTRRIRIHMFSHVIVKHPAFLAQQLVTLDSVSSGRAEMTFSTGDFRMLEQFGIAGRSPKPIRRMREAHKIINDLTEGGRVEVDGEFYKHEGLMLNVRGVQDHIPVMIGGTRGPMSFELAGEISDGLMAATMYANDALGFAADRFRAGARRGGRDPETLRLSAALAGAISMDFETGRRAVRGLIAGYVSRMGDDMLEREGVDPASIEPARKALARDDIGEAQRLLPDGIERKLARPYGTAEDWVRELKELAALGYKEVVLALVTPFVLEQWGCERIDGLGSLEEQLQLIHDHVLPEVAGL